MRLGLRILVCLGFAVLGFSVLASATQIAYRSPRDLGEQAGVVVRGKVLSVDSYWNAKHTKIFTRTRIAVDETYKGAHRPVLNIVQLGGSVGTVKVTVQGALIWRVGEEVLVFAEPYDASSFQVSGFSQGKFRIERDPRTGVAYVDAPPLEGISLVGTPAQQAPSETKAKQRATLDEFVGRALGRSEGKGVER